MKALANLLSRSYEGRTHRARDPGGPLRGPEGDNLLLLASGFGEDGRGGLFRYDGSRLEEIDDLSCTGLCLAGRRLARFLPRSEGPGGSELLVYDDQGVERYSRIDVLSDPHQVTWDGSCLIVASSYSNAIFWLDESGSVKRRWDAPGEVDSWHLNGLYILDGDLYVSAFGRYERFRDWNGKAGQGDGIVFNLRTGLDEITGLSLPHNPVFFDGMWAVCNSGAKELLQVDRRTKRVLRRVDVGGFSRGIAVSQDRIFVGVSSHRSSKSARQNAGIVVLSRRSWRVLEEIQLPCREVFDLLLVPSGVVEGVKRGFRTNDARVAEQEQRSLFDAVGVTPSRLWAVSDPLPAEACRVRLTATAPEALPAGATLELDCSVENRGDAFLVSAAPNPVRLSYHWIAADGTASEGLRSNLPLSLRPGTRANGKMLVTTPDRPGPYILKVSLVQEFVRWFDEVDQANGISLPITIFPSESAG